MELLERFKHYLLNDLKASKITVKNYQADIRKFTTWYEGRFHSPFNATAVTKDTVEDFKVYLNGTQSAARSNKRYESSLRKFFSYLQQQNIVTRNPFEIQVETKQIEVDPWHLKDFKNHLYTSNASNLTIKNYLIDIQQFTVWSQKVFADDGLRKEDYLNLVDIALINEYKQRLLNEMRLSPVSVNRKLSSLRKYLSWTNEKKWKKTDVSIQSERKPLMITESQIIPEKEIVKKSMTLDDLKNMEFPRIPEEPATATDYSKVPPIRLIQKMKKVITLTSDMLFFVPIAKAVAYSNYKLWKAKGKTVFVPIQEVLQTAAITLPAEAASQLTATTITNTLPAVAQVATNTILRTFTSTAKDETRIRNIPKSFYAPLSISTKNFSWPKKLLYHLRYTRPQWYRKYSSYTVVRYMQFAVLMIFITLLTVSFYKAFVLDPHSSKKALASLPAAPPRLLSFKGKLTDPNNNPLTAESKLRFAIYNSKTGTGSAQLWQDTMSVKPDNNGNFSVLLGQKRTINQSIFTNNPNLYLGIAVGNDMELKPREQLANVSEATSANTVQGLAPITQANAGTRNVILALDSSGNLTIGGNASPTFQATGGTLTLSGQILTLASNAGSNGDIQIAPDGSGLVDIQKPIHNSTYNNNIPGIQGAVEIDDSLAILATSSAQPAFIINQNSTGDLISASASGIAKFSVDYTGAGTFAGNLGINGNNLTSNTSTFNLLNTNVINLNIGGNASAITLGASYGTTTINNSLNVNGISLFKSAFNANGMITANAGITVADGQKITLKGHLPGSITYIGHDNELATDNDNFFWDATNKQLGIGTATPSATLDVHGNADTKNIAQIYNTSTGADADGLAIKLGTDVPTTSNQYISFMNGSGTVLGKITGNGTNSGLNTIVYNTNGADYAEYYKKANPAEGFATGDLVCISVNNGVTKCAVGSPHLVGIVSRTAGFVGNSKYDTDPGYVLVGIVGQLPLTISPASGAISSGDALTFSPDADGAVKADKAGEIIGRAIESFNPHSGQKSITVAVQISWFDPSVKVSSAGNVLSAVDDAIKKGNNANLINQIASALQSTPAIINDALSQAPENVMIGSQTLHDYIASVATETITNTQNTIFTPKIVSPVAGIATVNTNVISPLSPTSEIAMGLKDHTIAIYNNKNASGSAVTTFDNQGNAHFDGDISARQASFSGTIRAQKIITDQLELSPEALAKLRESTGTTSANYITNVTNIYNSIATPSATATPSGLQATITPTPAFNAGDATASDEAALKSSELPSATNYVSNIATFSAGFANVPELKTEFGTFNQGLVALGPSSMADLSLHGQLTIGNNMMISDTSINTVGSDLSLQPLRQGNLSIMGGLVAIDTEGNLSVSGNAVFAKNVLVNGALAANIIAPVPNQDIALQTGGNDTHDSSIVIKNESGNGVMSINHLGDLIASGSGTFADIAANALHIVRGAQADTSLTETVANGSAGSAVLSGNEIQRTIFTPYVKEGSLIYVTATSDTQNVTPYIARQTAENAKTHTRGSFTIQIPHAVAHSINLNWWIVN